MRIKLSVFAVVLMICSFIAVPVSAATASEMKCGGCQVQCEQKEKKGCSSEKKECDGEKKECGSEKKEQSQDKEKAQEKTPA